MIEKIIADYIKNKIKVYTALETPQNPPKRFIIVEKVGSGRENFINRATLAIKSHAETLYEAAVLNELIKSIMEDAKNLIDISKAELEGDYPFNDTALKQYRYQAVYTIYY